VKREGVQAAHRGLTFRAVEQGSARGERVPWATNPNFMLETVKNHLMR